MSPARWLGVQLTISMLADCQSGYVIFTVNSVVVVIQYKNEIKRGNRTTGVAVAGVWRSTTLTPSALFRMTPATLAARRPTARQVSLSCPASARRSLGLPRPSIPTPVALWAAFLAALLEVRTLFRELQDLRLLPSPGKEVSW